MHFFLNQGGCILEDIIYIVLLHAISFLDIFIISDRRTSSITITPACLAFDLTGIQNSTLSCDTKLIFGRSLNRDNVMNRSAFNDFPTHSEQIDSQSIYDIQAVL
jgi:hypothetical protein